MRHNCTLCSECVARFKCVIYYIYQRSTVRGLPWQNNLMVLEGIYLIIYLLSPRFILLAKLFPAYQDGNLLLCNPLKSQLANFGPPAVLCILGIRTQLFIEHPSICLLPSCLFDGSISPMPLKILLFLLSLMVVCLSILSRSNPHPFRLNITVQIAVHRYQASYGRLGIRIYTSENLNPLKN